LPDLSVGTDHVEPKQIVELLERELANLVRAHPNVPEIFGGIGHRSFLVSTRAGS
jgi:hypothetical protein